MNRLAVPIIGILGLCAPGLRADWSTFHGDAALRGRVEARLPDRPARLWHYAAGDPVLKAPVAAGDTVVVLTEASEIVALDTAGRMRWSKRVPNGRKPDGTPAYVDFRAPPAIVNGVLLLGATDGALYAFDLQSGGVRWTNSAGSAVAGSAIGFQTPEGAWRVLAVAQPEGVLHAFELESGKRVWASDPTARCDGSPAVSGDKAVFGSCASALHVIGLADGKLIRTIPVGEDSQMAGGVALDGDEAFVGTRSGRLVCADLRAGTIRWAVAHYTGELFTTPAVGTDRVVSAADDGKVRCVRRSDGSLAWAAETEPGAATSPALAGDKVVAAGGGRLFLLRLEDGKPLWSAALGDDTSGPAIAGNRIIIGGDDGRVSAFGEAPP